MLSVVARRGPSLVARTQRRLLATKPNTEGLFAATPPVQPPPVQPTEKPKRPLGKFMLFCQDYRAARPGEKVSAKALGEAWNALLPAQRLPYEQTSVAEMDAYKAQMQAWKATAPPAKKVSVKVKKDDLKERAKAVHLDYPKRMSGWTLYQTENPNNLAASVKGEKRTMLSNEWKNLSEAQKKIYKEKASAQNKANEELFKVKLDEAEAASK